MGEQATASAVEEADRRALTEDDLRSMPLIGADLRGQNLSGMDLSGLNFSNADLSDARLIGTSLKGATLFEAILTGAQLTGADLSDGNLDHCVAALAGFGGADLANTSLLGADLSGATLSGANGHQADLRGANLTEARLHKTDLTEADLSKATAASADLTEAVLTKATLTETDLSKAILRRVKGFETADWIGVDIAEADFTGAYTARRFILDQNYLHEFKTRDRKHLVLYEIWRLTSDCGQSALRWGGLTAMVAIVFALAYTQVDIDYGSHETALSPLYFSVVTLDHARLR